jgi:5-methylthioadenosine/S-adenosylhomocysteine deaminase
MGGLSEEGGVGSEVHLLIEGGIVITMDAECRIYDPGYVAIQGRKIVGTGNVAACPYSAKERLDASNMLVLPGIVNAHNHLDQSVHRTCLDELWPIRR